MRLECVFGLLKPLASAALVATALAGCDDARIETDGEKGRPLADLDLSGPAPTGLVLLGPDEVRLREGPALAITLDGEEGLRNAMRFALKDGTLGILREDGSRKTDGAVIVNVTMPPPERLIAAGSGTIRAEALAGRAEVTIAGSGDVETLNVGADRLEVKIAGPGVYRAAGTARELDLGIFGSGDAAMEALKADKAKIKIAGSGRSHFASDGVVEADIPGSGEVRVTGRAKCTAKATGSGKLICTAM